MIHAHSYKEGRERVSLSLSLSLVQTPQVLQTSRACCTRTNAANTESCTQLYSRFEQCEFFSHRDAITFLTSTRAAAQSPPLTSHQPPRQPNHVGSARGAGSLRCCHAPVRLSRTIATAGQAASELLEPAAHRTWLTPIGSSSTRRQATPLRGGATIRRRGDGHRSRGDDSNGVLDLLWLHWRLPCLLLRHWGCQQAVFLSWWPACAVVIQWPCRLCSAATGRICRGVAAHPDGHSF